MNFSAICDSEFQNLSEKERIYQYSTPKVHRLLQILKTYTPFYTKEANTPEKKTNSKNIFTLLMYLSANHVYFEMYHLKSYLSDTNSKDCITKSDKDIISPRTQEKVQPKKFGGNWKSNNDNYKKTPKSQRYLCGNTDPDLLCGVIFVDKGFIAKVIFYLLNVCIQIITY